MRTELPVPYNKNIALLAACRVAYGAIKSSDDSLSGSDAARLRRREVLIGLAAAAVLNSGGVSGEDAQKSWAAVVIGVDHAGSLPVLRAAVSGAKDMASWLTGQNYEVKLFTDEAGAVKVSAIFDAIQSFMNRGTFSRLVVYFAGHGFISQLSEFWLLSGAPENPNEAINLLGSAYLARLSTIRNVVFISDACRSRASDLRTANINGAVIFPSVSRPPRSAADVDQFYATQIGDTASEGALADSVNGFHGIYTESFLSAFKNPSPDFVTTIDGQQVIPDRDLQRYLLDDVPKRAASLSITLRQNPDAIVTSSDKAYLGRISGITQSASQTPSVFTTKDLAAVAMTSAAAQISLDLDPALTEIGRKSGYFDTHDIVINSAVTPAQFKGRTGFVVYNTGVRQVAVTQGATVSLIESPVPPKGSRSSNVAFIHIEIEGAHDTSALIQFGDGSATIAAILPGFVGTIAVDKGGVVSLNYTPSLDSGRGLDPQDRQRLEQLRANAAAAARLGVLRADTPKEAARLADAIRVLKGIDPTLGLYAAYAYEQAGLLDEIRSVAAIMRSDIGLLLFDVAMLAGVEPVKTVQRGGFIAPFCPMLSQGWNYLGATRSAIPAEAIQASRHLRQALWTTFDSEGAEILLTSSLFRGNMQ